LLPANDITACGIKDKRAVTFQQISITLRRREGLQCDHAYWRESVISACRQLFTINDWNWRRNDTPDAAGLAVGNFCLLTEPLFVGGNWGNHFKIKIRSALSAGIPAPAAVDIERMLRGRLARIAVEGFPNFFGTQRMGVLRDYSPSSSASSSSSSAIAYNRSPDSGMPLGPQVGKLLLQGRLKEAIEAIIVGAGEGEEEDVDVPVAADYGGDDATADSACERTQAHTDDDTAISSGAGQRAVAARALFESGASAYEVWRCFPAGCQRERALLKGMIRHGWGAEGEEGRVQCERVLEMLPYHTRLLWVHSYQVLIIIIIIIIIIIVIIYI